MKRKRQITGLLLAVLLCASMLLTACGAKEVSYQVKVTDAMGYPYTKFLAVKFMRGDEQVGIQAVNQEGVAEMTLPKGTYTVELNFTDPDRTIAYDSTDLTLSAETPQLTVIANPSLSEKSETLYVGEEEYAARFANLGCNGFALDADKMTYILFEPTEAGKYEFSLADTEAAIGYYGTPHFVLQGRPEPNNNTLTLSVSQEEFDNGATQLVLGVSAGEGSAVLKIFRTGDVEQPAEMPWSTDWQTGHSQSDKCRVVPTGKLRYFDITAKSGKINLFYDEETGYYRQKKNGPVVLVALGKNNNPKYSGVGLYERVNGNGMYGGSDVVRYFQSEDGTVEKREKYTDLLLEMFAHSDITAYDQEVYHPLTQDLMYVLQNGFAGWWDPESPDYQETFANANPEYAWLFACCYQR